MIVGIQNDCGKQPNERSPLHYHLNYDILE